MDESGATTPSAHDDGIVDRLRGGLIVSCQAPEGDPLHGPDHMAAMAESVARGPIVGIRAEGVADLTAIRAVVDLPLIGLWKDGTSGVYITPTPAHARAVLDTGVEIVAADATLRPRPDGSALSETIATVHGGGRLFLADVSTVQEGVAAAEAGADLVATTLSGYTPDSPRSDEPDLELISRLVELVPIPVLAEGRMHTPQHARAALDAGAWAVVVGSAITAPLSIVRRFTEALPG